eukprot:gnl/TRDRNA2_/TRDRNA2_43949_c0_seq1.p1 gnl/TRDRNA2_/TRDRNA2_43949_c0~~gnl/TRDRNA2_/TRDRNA2_43949_c0_seq1.p1  ORF type:complete len:300 (-),score=21.10 gnl/TRDRNA2_/TRDRNA2_43949_c0_seq1:44-943(-)
MGLGQSTQPKTVIQGHVGRRCWLITCLAPPIYVILCVAAFTVRQRFYCASPCAEDFILVALVFLGLCPLLAVLIPFCCSLCFCCDTYEVLALIHRRVFGNNFELPVCFELSEDGLKIFAAPFPCMGCWRSQLFDITSILRADVYTRLRFRCTGWENPIGPRGNSRKAREAAQRPPVPVHNIEEMQRKLLSNKKVRAYHSTIHFAFLGVQIGGEPAVIPLSRRVFDLGLCCDELREMFPLADCVRNWLQLGEGVQVDIIGVPDEQRAEEQSVVSSGLASTAASTADLDLQPTQGTARHAV